MFPTGKPQNPRLSSQAAIPMRQSMMGFEEYMFKTYCSYYDTNVTT